MDTNELIDNNSHYEPMAQGGVGDPETGYWETTGPAFDGSTPQWIDTRPIQHSDTQQRKTTKKEQRERTPEEQERINERMRLLRERKRRKREEAAHAADTDDTMRPTGVSHDVSQLYTDKRDHDLSGDDGGLRKSIPQKAPRHLAPRFVDRRGGVDNELHPDTPIITETRSTPGIDRNLHTEGHGDRFISPAGNIAHKTPPIDKPDKLLPATWRDIDQPKREAREERRNVRRTRAEIDEGDNTYAQDVVDHGYGAVPPSKRASLSQPPFDGEPSRFQRIRGVLPRADSHVQRRVAADAEQATAGGVGNTGGPSFSSISSLILPIIKIGAICFGGYIAFNQLGGGGAVTGSDDDDKSAPFPPPNMEIVPDGEEDDEGRDSQSAAPSQQKPLEFVTPSSTPTPPALTKMDVNKTPTPSRLLKVSSGGTIPQTLIQ